MVKFLDLVKQYDTIRPEMDAAIARVIENSSFIGGKEVANFETHFARYQDAEFCVGVGNGTDALEIAIEVLDLPANSEIVVPANSFIASAEAVTRSGHSVVFCDSDPHTHLIDIEDCARSISPKTAAIMAVHLYGQPAPMRDILALAQKHDLRVIEDAAQAHGAEIDGKRIGGVGDIGTFSFYPGKNLGAYGDGGAIVTNDAGLAKRSRMIANHGRVDKYDHEFEGRNSRLDGLQAAVLETKLRHLDAWIERRNAIAKVYHTKLSGIEALGLPVVADNVRHAYHLFVVSTKQRDELRKFLASVDIQTGIHYPVALPDLKAYDYLRQKTRTFAASDTADTLVSLPIGDHMTDADANRVADAITEFYA
ncbi:MAG: DegT/DnrJ/EryC1/StrS family aminotransferase [Pseudomonadota bacterium]